MVFGAAALALPVVGCSAISITRRDRRADSSRPTVISTPMPVLTKPDGLAADAAIRALEAARTVAVTVLAERGALRVTLAPLIAAHTAQLATLADVAGTPLGSPAPTSPPAPRLPTRPAPTVAAHLTRVRVAEQAAAATLHTQALAVGNRDLAALLGSIRASALGWADELTAAGAS